MRLLAKTFSGVSLGVSMAGYNLLASAGLFALTLARSDYRERARFANFARGYVKNFGEQDPSP